jgi:hypothetical protein
LKHHHASCTALDISEVIAARSMSSTGQPLVAPAFPQLQHCILLNTRFGLHPSHGRLVLQDPSKQNEVDFGRYRQERELPEILPIAGDITHGVILHLCSSTVLSCSSFPASQLVLSISTVRRSFEALDA